MGELSAKLKNKKFQKTILIYFVIFLAIIFLLNWLIKSGQADRNKNQAENFNDYYKGLSAQCGKDKEIHDCCFNSVAYMAQNDLKVAGIGCEPGFKLNTFSCKGTYKWCEMIR